MDGSAAEALEGGRCTAQTSADPGDECLPTGLQRGRWPSWADCGQIRRPGHSAIADTGAGQGCGKTGDCGCSERGTGPGDGGGAVRSADPRTGANERAACCSTVCRRFRPSTDADRFYGEWAPLFL